MDSSLRSWASTKPYVPFEGVEIVASAGEIDKEPVLTPDLRDLLQTGVLPLLSLRDLQTLVSGLLLTGRPPPGGLCCSSRRWLAQICSTQLPLCAIRLERLTHLASKPRLQSRATCHEAVICCRKQPAELSDCLSVAPVLASGGPRLQTQAFHRRCSSVVALQGSRSRQPLSTMSG